MLLRPPSRAVGRPQAGATSRTLVGALVLMLLGGLMPAWAAGQSPTPSLGASPGASASGSLAPSGSPGGPPVCAADVAPRPSPSPSTIPGASASPSGAPVATAPASVGPSPSSAGSGSSAALARSASTTDAPVSEEGEPRQRALAEIEVFGFLPDWDLDGASETIDLERLTTLAWFGVEAGGTGRLVRQEQGVVQPGWSGWTSPEFAALKERAQASGVRVVLTVTRFSWARADARRTIKLLRDPGARDRLVREITGEIAARSADGVNLDFEPLPPAVRDQFTCFVRELRYAFEAQRPGLQITFDVVGGGVEAHDLAALTADDAADAAFLMGYDYRTASSPDTGSISPLDDPDDPDLRESVMTALALTTGDRLILGLPWYARVWSAFSQRPHARTRSGPRLPGSETDRYPEALAEAQRSGRQWDEGDASAWTYYVRRLAGCPHCPETWRQLWYDDVDAFRAKVDFALDEGLRGIGIWEVGYGGTLPDLWTVIELAVEGRIDTQAPVGRAALDPASSRARRAGLPIVRDLVRIDLAAVDDPGGTGVAFVRLSNRDAIAEDGSLVDGQTYPATDTVTWSMVTGLPFDPPRTRRRGAQRTTAAAGRPDRGRQVIRVQWRDIAGNWSDPVRIAVWYRPGRSTIPAPAPSPSPSPAPSPSPSPAPSGSPTPSPGG